MQHFTRRVLILFGAAFSAWAQPSIGGILNPFTAVGAPLDSNNNPIGNNNIAQGSFMSIYGIGLGSAAGISASSLPLATSLPDVNGTSVSVSSGGQTVKAFISFARTDQVNAILPSNTPVGVANVTVTYNGQTSKPATITVVKTQFVVRTQNARGDGPAYAQVFTGSSAYVMGLTTPAQPGDTLVMYGIGLGAINRPDNEPPGFIEVGSNVTVNIAGNVVPASYAGRSPDFPGLDQVNFVLPANVPTGCYIPAEVTASGRPSNLIHLSIATAAAAACTHPLGLPAAALKKLDTFGGTVNTGLFLMLRAVVLGVPAEGAGGLFDTVNANGAFQLYSRIQFAFGAYNFPVAAGSCAVLDTIDPPAGFSVPDFSTLGGKELIAGSFLNLSGTNSNSAVLPRQIPDTGGYLTVFFNTLGKGTWTLTGSGGPDVGTFTAKTDLPDDLVWSNAGNLANPPRTDLTILWTGANLNAQSLVTVVGASVVINPNDPSLSRGKQFFCNALASAGRLVVPQSVVSQLPSASVASGEVYFGQLGIYSGNGSTFTAPLTSGATFDGGFLSYGEAHTLSVRYQ